MLFSKSSSKANSAVNTRSNSPAPVDKQAEKSGQATPSSAKSSSEHHHHFHLYLKAVQHHDARDVSELGNNFAGANPSPSASDNNFPGMNPAKRNDSSRSLSSAKSKIASLFAFPDECEDGNNFPGTNPHLG